MRYIEMFSEVPWGAIAFVLLVIYGAWLLVSGQGGVKYEDLAGAIAVGSGLHGIGHGIRNHGRQAPARP